MVAKGEARFSGFPYLSFHDSPREIIDYRMNCARSLLKSTSKTVGRLYRRNFSETAVHKNIWIEEHNGIKEDLTNRFEWSATNIMNSVIFLGLIPGFIYLVGKEAQNVFVSYV